jgi:transposase
MLVGDRGYDADKLRADLLTRGILPVIPAKRGRREPAAHDATIYRLRNRIERLIGRLKQNRRIATRYDKTAENYLAFVYLAASRVWLRFVHTA